MNTNRKPEYSVHINDDRNTAGWDAFLDASDSANFYQRLAWQKINESNFGHKTFYLTATSNGAIHGVFPLIFIESRIFGRILASMPFMNYGGPCALNPEANAALIEEAKRLTAALEADYLEIRTIKPADENLPTLKHKASMTLALEPDPDVLWNSFKSKLRTNIRRVYKNGVRVEIGHINLLPVFYNIIANTWRSLGTPVYREKYFKSILDAFPDETRIFIAYLDDIPVATAFNGYYKGTVEGMWAGALPNFRSAQPNYVLYWEMMKHACEHGYSHFHLGRSTAGSGSEDFKKKWNAVATQLHWQYILNRESEIPQLNVNNPKYKLAISLWKRLPIYCTTRLGPLLARNIP